ncbi:hypothetical protein [Colwellia sp. MB02u-14]|uniref:hypothetical protein n=1 Tax=Colwellia sp. MB02u-14 TaxID=2759815 RepID=UPI0015F35766|nr:hypothetical protein [Colwellia sp. MB02u-14]MBA6304915.1 hypothetical protein [Colwellia sp. MB02u-14]
MKPIDITDQILKMHEEEVIQQMITDTQEELASDIPSDLQKELDLCLSKANMSERKSTDHVISFTPKENNIVAFPFAETELLAASGKSLADWFAQPMNFGGAGFVLDVRRVLGSDNEVDLYLTPNEKDNSKMKSSLLSYLGKSLTIDVNNNGASLLNATLYVDESGCNAEGSGYLSTDSDSKDIKGKISINILLDDK